MSEPANHYWSEEVETTYHTPPGTFTKNAQNVVEILLQGADDNPELALRRLVFYINRAGEKLENTHQLSIAKELLENLIKTRKLRS